MELSRDCLVTFTTFPIVLKSQRDLFIDPSSSLAERYVVDGPDRNARASNDRHAIRHKDWQVIYLNWI